ncbi:MAG: hypothetical protein ACJ793_06200, partial [Gemmatimonadaceae bacterium]
NTVARVAGLLAIAIFGVLLVRRFEAEMRPRLERMELSQEAKAQILEELPKMAGAQIGSVSIEEEERAQVKRAIDESFLAGFRIVVMGAAVLALGAAAFGSGISSDRKATSARSSP